MRAPLEVRLSTRLQRKDPGLPVYVVEANRHIKKWGLTGTTLIEGTANLADPSTPKELEGVLSTSQRLTAVWQALSERERRDAGEHIRAARTQATRERRAASIAERLRRKAKTNQAV